MRMDRIRVGPFRYLYLDATGIDSLYAQTMESVETEITIARGKKRSTKIGGKASLGQTLSKVFGLPELAVQTDFAQATDSSEIIKTYRTAEQKLANVIRYLEQLGAPAFYSDVHAAAENCTNTGQSTYICIGERFDLQGFRGGSDAGIELINRQGAMVFEKDQRPDDYDDSDNYYKKPEKVPITMAASLRRSGGRPFVIK